jgi:hypothetical protein
VGKLANLAAVKSAKAESFVYIPPDKAFGAALILVKPQMNFATPAPTVIHTPILASVLRGLRRAAPNARIMLTESVNPPHNTLAIFEAHGVQPLMDQEMRAAPLEELILKQYPNPAPHQYPTLLAPAYLEDYDCVISVSTLKQVQHPTGTLVLGGVHNLTGFLPRTKYPRDDALLQGTLYEPDPLATLREVYATFAPHIDGSVLDLTALYRSDTRQTDRLDTSQPFGQVVWGDDLLAVETIACQLTGMAMPNYTYI